MQNLDLLAGALHLAPEFSSSTWKYHWLGWKKLSWVEPTVPSATKVN